ncbi:hypothetical protein IQ250_19220 [Pseudanabaenaceae cyanobacterium LEGE 13415]|nr:hypothetical protein [Pseudanabaenaceae cyanobacterium LEGE 13415]
MAKNISVTLEQSGGFAGLMLTKTVNTQTLSPAEAQQLEALVEESNFFQLSSIEEASPQPDRFGYTLSVEVDGRSHSVQFSETNMPEKVRSLVEWIQTRLR